MSEEATEWRGIVLAGGAGTRLHPMTQVASKQLLPVYDKPMIYYPISILMLGGIRDILIISTPQDLPRFQELLGDGSRFGLRLEYREQPRPEGIAQAFILGEEFIGGANVCLILGDNLFYGDMKFMRNAMARAEGGTVFAYPVQDPERYGVVEFDKEGRAISIEEKPDEPRSHYAVPGLYCYDGQVVDITREMAPSARGELEITDVNLEYMRRKQLHVELMGRGMAWLDTGTPESLLDAANFVATIEKRQGFKIACLEEIAMRKGWVDPDQVLRDNESLRQGQYGSYVAQMAEEYLQD